MCKDMKNIKTENTNLKCDNAKLQARLQELQLKLEQILHCTPDQEMCQAGVCSLCGGKFERETG